MWTTGLDADLAEALARPPAQQPGWQHDAGQPEVLRRPTGAPPLTGPDEAAELAR